MVKATDVLYYIWHIQEFRSIIQWNVWHQPVHERDEDKEPITLRKCFDYLDKTSRSFSAVIKELNPELLVPICLFYLVLRGLDTIEDDMTIAIDDKDPLLRTFHKNLKDENYRFDGSGPNEKDRDLLVNFDVVTKEFAKIKPAYQKIIMDITTKMGSGMADYASNAESKSGVNTIDDYKLYCHYVAGLVGEGLTRLFVESGLANPALLKRPELQESMGQFLQQVNIMRDVKEDFDQGRRFWPKEVWSKYVDDFEDLFKPQFREKALQASSEMVLIALQCADDCLFYLAGIKDQSVFNFAAIPQSMAIATIELCFRNPKMFERNIKITKGQACRLMMQSTQNLQVVCGVFKDFVRKIHLKNDPRDPNFLRISVACGRIEQFIESIFPTRPPPEVVASPMTLEEEAKKKAAESEARWDMIYMIMAVCATLFIISCFMIFIAWFVGARFDIAFGDLAKNMFNAGGSKPLDSPAAGVAREDEL